MFKIIYLAMIYITINNILFSQSVQEVQKLRNEYEKMKKQNKLSVPSNNMDIEIGDINDTPDRVVLIPYNNETLIDDSISQSDKFFGYEFFTKRDTVGFWENLSIPQNYVLGPGDEIIISLWGETSLRNTFTISRSGKIYDEKKLAF